MSATASFTRSGIRRSGDDYQDLVALDLLVEMLEHPSRYEWVQVEADDAGALDDVVALRADGRFVARQVKFAGYPDDEVDAWSWERLLQEPGREGRTRPSLLARWFSSWRRLRDRGGIAEAALVSNRGAAPELLATLEPDNRVAFEAIPEDARADITRQLGTEDEARAFFAEFRFSVDRPAIATLEEGLRRRFLALGGTEFGWLALKDELRFWVRERRQPPPDGMITLPFVRAAARWHQLQPLREDFVVPDDYTLPSAEFDAQFFAKVTAHEGRCSVLTGRPGLGKSTYLSHLVARLKAEKVPVIRHHYFLMMGERIRGRLDHRQVAESLMCEIQSNYPESLGQVGASNPNSDQLGIWLETCGAHFAAQGKELVIVVDGLDHVWRERGSREELDRLFEHLLPVPAGVALVVGTQPVDDDQLPLRLAREVPRDKWSELPLLDRAAVRAWLGHHESELDLSEYPDVREYTLERLSNSFHAKTGGHPLHVRFTLRALLERGLAVSSEAITSLPGTAHPDIERYYAELWQSLPEQGRGILHLLAATGFPWPVGGVVSALDPSRRDTVTVNGALREVRHLLVDGPLGLQPFHSSLFVFVGALPPHAIHAPILREKALRWLESEAPDYWRWAYIWPLEAELGREGPLLDGPDRAWVVDAIARGYPPEQLAELLARSALAALRAGRLVRFIEVGLLLDYAGDLDDANPDLARELWPAQMALDPSGKLRSLLRARRDHLRAEELVILAREEAGRMNDTAVREILDALQRRWPRRTTAEEKLRWASAVVSIVGLLPDVDVGPLAKFVAQFRDNGVAGDILDAYARALRRGESMRNLRVLLSASVADPAWSTNERDVAARHAVVLALEEGVDLAVPGATGLDDPFTALYSCLRDGAYYGVVRYPPPPLLDRKAGDLSSRRRAASIFFHQAFFALLADHLSRDGSSGREWVAPIPDPFARDLLTKLELLSMSVADAARARRPVAFAEPYQSLRGVPRPQWSVDQEAGDLAAGMEQAITAITFDLISMQGAWGAIAHITRQDLEEMGTSRYWERWTWLVAYLDHGRRLLNDEAANWLLGQWEGEVDTSVEPFATRASHYALLASLAALHRRPGDEIDRLVRKAASNSLAYGGHKDLLLDSALAIARECHAAGSRRAEQWLLALAPAIAHVEDFTDGDETGHLPRELGEVLADVAPAWLPRYYFWLCDREEYYDARSVFHAFLTVVDLNDPVLRAVALTAIDDGSIGILRDRAAKGDAGASEVLTDIIDFLGDPLRRVVSRREGESGQEAPPRLEMATPDPERYPPPQVAEYLAAAEPTYLAHSEECLRAWLAYWRGCGEGPAAYDAAVALVRSGREVRIADVLFELARQFHGRGEAYPWLVAAQRESGGWSRFFTSEEDAMRRWQAIERWYPERWLEFVGESIPRGRGEVWEGISARDKVYRLVKFCILVGQVVLAEGIAEQVIASTLALVSPVTIAVPAWATQD